MTDAQHSPTEHFEELAEQFYQETHLMAPGKDWPAAGGSRPEPTLLAFWELWCKHRNLVNQHAALVDTLRWLLVRIRTALAEVK